MIRIIAIALAVALTVGGPALAQQPSKPGMGDHSHGHGRMHGGGSAGHVPAAASDTSSWSEKRAFQVQYQPSVSPAPLNRLHAWTVTVKDPAGHPVAGATVSVDGGMPEHDHGLPTAPEVKSLGGGTYLVEGMKFHMPGTWIVKLRIVTATASDVATFRLALE